MTENPKTDAVESIFVSSQNKIQSRETLASLCEKFRLQGKKIGFTSGVFDLLHAGHVDYLEQAKNLCDVLIVGLNSDESVKGYKGPDRPIIPQAQRAKVLAGLAAVDFVFIFSERRNARNIEALKPDFYIKAGDYNSSQLTSGEIVEQYGGQAILIPVTEPVSTSDIIQRLQTTASQPSRTAQEAAVCLELPKARVRPAVFLDRDGTINREIEYLHEPEKFELLPGAGEGLRKLQDLGFLLVIVTNQAGIGLGYFRKEDFYKVNRKMFRELAPFGVKIDRIYFCPHNVSENCSCRKPETGLVQQAQQDLNIDLKSSYVIGDTDNDIELGQRLGMRAILVKTGHGVSGDFRPDLVADNLLDAAYQILNLERQEQMRTR